MEVEGSYEEDHKNNESSIIRETIIWNSKMNDFLGVYILYTD